MLADDESERVYAGGQLEAFHAHEVARAAAPHGPGPSKLRMSPQWDGDGTAGPNLRGPSFTSGPVGLGSSGVGSGRPKR